ncbi:APC family permease [Streptomyces ipomoeae]|uniref:APC family permease n=1 Tax=Streptomyces ipomoeae TaxID=103232 RepID=UPI0011465DC1|nr:APC family permease [Streptomyces ipomoeae]MDX2937851.1 APC family permease [Streptomyces ipomoeae]TQE27469.1 APC family permease [Streptomyces ipomoeae]
MSDTPSTSLGRAKISMAGVLAQSVGFMGPVFSVASLLPLIVGRSATGRGAGAATPVAIIIAGIGIFGAGWVIAQYAKRIHLCGSLYEYVCDAFGPRVGVISGWLYFGAMIVLGAATFLVLGGLTQGLLLSAFHVDVPWWPLALVYVALVAVIVVVGVQFSVRAQLALVLVSSAVVAGFSVYIIAKGGLGGHSLSAEPFNPFSISGLDLLYGVLYGINMFIGFESAANLAEETDDPKRHVPRAVLWSLTIVGAYFVLTAYAQDVGFGLDETAWKNSVFPLEALASSSPFGSPVFGNLISVLIILDVAAVAIGVNVAATRGMLSMARAGRLPAALATVHPRFRTPVVGTALIAVVSTVGIVLVVASDGVFSRATGQPGVLQPQWAPMFGWMAGFGGAGLALMYLAVSVAGARGLWHQVNRVKLVVASAAGILVSAGAVFGAFYKASSPLNTVSWALVVWIAAGVLWSLTMARCAGRAAPEGLAVTKEAAVGGERPSA